MLGALAPQGLARLALAVLAAAIGVMLLSSCTTSHFEPPQRLGPPGMVAHGEELRLWLVVKQIEQKQVRVGGGRSPTIWETRYHFDLQAHDARTTERVWKRRLLTLKDVDGGHGAQVRILGQDGPIVWLFAHDQPLAVSSADGSVVADRKLLEERNPQLQGLAPREPGFYAFDAGLVVTTADARHHRVRAGTYAVEPYRPASEEQFRRLQFMSTTWNGGYRTGDFLTRQASLGGRWLGLYSEKEAADAGDDGFGDHLKDPTRVLDEGARVRRTFWTARIGKTKQFTEGRHDRLFDVTRIPEAPEYMEAGLLIKQGIRRPAEVRDPAGLLVLHRTRLDAEGRLALTRLGADLREAWTATLPFLELTNRYEFPDRLVLYGAVPLTAKGVTRHHEFIVALGLRDGRGQAWNVTMERSVPVTAESAGR